MMTEFIDADFSVNDNNGNFKGTVGSIDVGDLLRVQCDLLHPVKIKYQVFKGNVRLCMQGKSFDIVQGSYYVGSIIFNSYTLTLRTGVKLINHLYNNDEWIVEEIDTRLLYILQENQLEEVQLIRFKYEDSL